MQVDNMQLCTLSLVQFLPIACLQLPHRVTREERSGQGQKNSPRGRGTRRSSFSKTCHHSLNRVKKQYYLYLKQILQVIVRVNTYRRENINPYSMLARRKHTSSVKDEENKISWFPELGTLHCMKEKDHRGLEFMLLKMQLGFANMVRKIYDERCVRCRYYGGWMATFMDVHAEGYRCREPA